MGPETVSRTAIGTTAGRAIESFRAKGDRLFEDRFAMGFLPSKHRALVQILRAPILGSALLALRERQIPGIMGNLICRTRFIDDSLREAITNGIEQLVILGAGLDSRAYRIPGTGRIHVLELDHPATQSWKRGRIERILREPQPHVTFVPIDFEHQELGEVLFAGGFRTGRKTFFIWEGVTQYIDANAVDSVFRCISRAAARGSRVAFTYINRGIIDGSVQMDGAKEIIAEVERQGEPWIFGIHPAELTDFLAERDLKLVEDVGASDYRKRYLNPAGRKMNLFDGERVAVAEITGTE